jgi:hypothetical protein
MKNTIYSPDKLSEIGYAEARKVSASDFDIDDLASEFVLGALIAAETATCGITRGYQYAGGMSRMRGFLVTLKRNARRECPTYMMPGSFRD